MINLDREPLIKLSAAARLVPARRDGKHVSATTIWRWTKFGHRGIKLEAVRRPSGDWLTSAAAVSRFLAAIAALDVSPPPPKERKRDWADDVLDAAGII